MYLKCYLLIVLSILQRCSTFVVYLKWFYFQTLNWYTRIYLLIHFNDKIPQKLCMRNSMRITFNLLLLIFSNNKNVKKISCVLIRRWNWHLPFVVFVILKTSHWILLYTDCFNDLHFDNYWFEHNLYTLTNSASSASSILWYS